MMSEWLPIETAPKNGIAVLLCWAINADGRPINWAKHPETAGVFVQVAQWREEDGGWIVYINQPREPRLHFSPTHWMPLPDPPTNSRNRTT